MTKLPAVSVVELERVTGGLALELSVPELEEVCRRHAANPPKGLSPVQSCLAGVAGFGAGKALQQLQAPQAPRPESPMPQLRRAPIEREA